MSRKSKIGRFVIFSYIGVLYAVNYPLRLYLNFLYNDPDKLNLRYFELKYILLLLSFLVLAVCIALEKENLVNFHFDKGSFILLASSMVLTLPIGPIVLSEYRGLISIAVSICLILTVLVRNWSKTVHTNAHWTLVGILITFIVLIPVNYLNQFTYIENESAKINFAARIIYNVLAVSTMEEMVFRGFLWGYFRSMGLSEKKAFVFQFVLFWLGHGGQINAPLLFLVSTPMSALVLSYLTYRSKQLFPSIVSHTMFNVLLDVLRKYG